MSCIIVGCLCTSSHIKTYTLIGWKTKYCKLFRTARGCIYIAAIPRRATPAPYISMLASSGHPKSKRTK